MSPFVTHLVSSIGAAGGDVGDEAGRLDQWHEDDDGGYNSTTYNCDHENIIMYVNT